MSNIELRENSLTAHQQTIFNSIIRHIESKVSSFFFAHKDYKEYMLSLTGAAGTGKTYLTTQVVKYLLNKSSDNYSFVVTAPTHKAASVLSNFFIQERLPVTAKTIHSFLGIKPFRDYYTGEEKFRLDKTKKDLDTTSILIVDESSMISSNLFDIILDALERKRVNFVLFVGDPFQLPPVNEQSSIVYELKHQLELKEIVRQARDSDIILLANKLRKAIETKEFIDLQEQFKPYMQNSKNIEFFYNKEDFLEDFYSKNRWFEHDQILASYTNKNVDAFNKIIRNRYWQEMGKTDLPTLIAGDKLRFNSAYSSEDVTIYSNNEIVQIESAKLKYSKELEIEYWECKEVNSIEQLIFRVVEPSSKNIFNNKLKAISSMAKAEHTKERREKLWKLFFGIRDMYADVQYIYAMTIHKLQGSTYKDVYIDMFSLVNNKYMSQEEKYRTVYVAITRASNKAKIFSKQFNQNCNEKDIDTKNKFNEIDTLLKNLFDN